MSIETTCKKISEPTYYHREYKNDIDGKAGEPSWGQQCQRAATVALPFFSLYKPLSLPISLGMGALRTFSCSSQLLASIKQGNNKDIPYQLLQTSIAVMALAGTIFAHPAGMLITTGHDLIIETVHLAGYLQRGEHGKALESCANIINNSLYLALFTHGGIELAIASFATQAMLGLYHSHGEFQKGNYLEATGHMLMAMIRGNQLVGQVKMLDLKWDRQAFFQNPQIKNVYNKITTDPSNLINNANVNSSVIAAQRVEQNYENGCFLHWGYYADGIVVITVVQDTSHRIPDGRQGIFYNQELINSTDYFGTEVVGGVTYIKHYYQNGAVYSTKDRQYIVIY